MPCYTRPSPTQLYLLRKSTGPPRSLWDPRKGLSHLEVQHPPPGDRLWCSAGSRGAGSYAAIHSLQRRGQRLCSQYLCYFLQQLTASSWMYIIVNLSQALIFLFYQKLFLQLFRWSFDFYSLICEVVYHTDWRYRKILASLREIPLDCGGVI